MKYGALLDQINSFNKLNDFNYASFGRAALKDASLIDRLNSGKICEDEIFAVKEFMFHYPPTLRNNPSCRLNSH